MIYRSTRLPSLADMAKRIIRQPSLRTYGGLIIQGDVVRVEQGHYFVKEKDGKEVRLQTDMATQVGRIKQGDHIVATVDEENHALSIHSVP